MAHQHQHPHRHMPAATASNERKIAAATLLTGLFMVAEIAGGVISGSLALLADAGHMLTDFASLGLAWFALRISRRPATWKRSYGFDRFSVLAAFVNGLALFVIAGWISWEAAHRFRHPPEILGGLMFWVAVGGLVVNLVAFRILSAGEGHNLNVRAAALHVMGDLLGSLAAIIAAVVIMATGWMPVDPLLSIVVVLIILRAAWRVVSESSHILLEGAPAHLDRREIAADLTEHVPGVASVSHIHAWSITEERPMITLEAEIAPDACPDATRRALKARLQSTFGVSHATVEIYPAGGAG